jgi:hypothetical protein
MTPAGTVYHVGDGHPSDEEQRDAFLYGKHEDFPFKLVSPDGTGGSSEIIIRNPNRKKHPIDKYNVWVSIANNLDFNEVTRGSYNYAETVIRGFTAHENMDVKPHERMTKGYINPPFFSPLGARYFPEKLP